MSNNPFAKAQEETQALSSALRTPGVPATALYEGLIKAAYLIPSPWNDNEMDLAMHIELPSGYEHKIQKAVLRDKSPQVTNAKTGKKELMWSYQQVSHIVGAALNGKTLADAFDSCQTKKVEIYDFDSRKDVLTDVQMVADLVGKKLLIGLQRKIANKNQKNSDGTWTPLPERKQTLEFGIAGSIDDRRTFVEIQAGIAPEEAKEVDLWEKANSGKDWNAYKEVAAVSGVPASVTAAPAAAIHDFGA